MIDASKYSSYCFVPGASGGTVKIFTASGYVQYSGAETFDVSGGLLICFTGDMNRPGVSDLLVEHLSGEIIIQTTLFESVLDTFGLVPKLNNEIDTYYVYSNSCEMATHVPVLSGSNLIEDTSTRCDYSNFGCCAFYSSEASFNKLHSYRNFLSITGVAHIIRLDVEGTNSANRENKNQTITLQTKTPGGAVKNLAEWSMVASPPWNNVEPTAVKAAEMISRLNIAQAVVDSIWAVEPYSYLGRYLSGETNYMEYSDETGILSEGLAEYLKGVYLYKTLSSLVSNHPTPPEIDEQILAEEKLEIESTMFEFFNRYGFAYEFVSSSEMLSMLRAGFMPEAQENRAEAMTALEKYIAYA